MIKSEVSDMPKHAGAASIVKREAFKYAFRSLSRSSLILENAAISGVIAGPIILCVGSTAKSVAMVYCPR